MAMPASAVGSSNRTIFTFGSRELRTYSRSGLPGLLRLGRRSGGAPAATTCPRRRTRSRGRRRRARSRSTRLGCEQLVDAVADGERRAGEEHADGGHQRPQEALLAVTERLVGRRLLGAEVQRHAQEALVDRVGDRVRGLGEHRARARHEAGGELRHGDDAVGRPSRSSTVRRLAASASAVGDAAAAHLLGGRRHPWVLPVVADLPPCRVVHITSRVPARPGARERGTQCPACPGGGESPPPSVA